MRGLGIVVALGLAGLSPCAAAIAPGAQAVHDFGRCIAPRETRTAIRLLATQPVSKAERNAARYLQDHGDPCLTFGTLGQPTLLLRGAVAEGLLAGPLAGAALHPAPATPVWPAPDASVDAGYRKTNEENYGLARCVVLANASGVRALLDSKLDTPEERAAFDGLRPALGPCATGIAGVRFDRPMLRALLAESLYMLTASGR